MTVILHMGVIDQPYSTPAGNGKKAARAVTTTGQVAEYLENRYHVMEHFYQARQQVVVDALTTSLKGSLETVMLGGPMPTNPFHGATDVVEDSFKKFLSSREIETLGYPGIPTKAALQGVNHRLKQRRGGRRPSFIDTGLYQSSFKAWVD